MPCKIVPATSINELQKSGKDLEDRKLDTKPVAN